MTHEPAVTPVHAYWLLVVASAHDVARAGRDFAAFLTFRLARLSSTDEERGRRVIGIWVDRAMVDAVPAVFDFGSEPWHGQFHVRETIGVNGVWSLCGLDVELREAVSVDTVRESLIDALAAIRPPREDCRVPRFLPVFDGDQHPLGIHVEMNRLREVFPHMVGEPVTWDNTTGALLRPAGPQSADES